MRLLRCRDLEQFHAQAARLFRARIEANQQLVLAPPAGRTPKGMYRLLADEARARPLDCSGLTVFAIDEIVFPGPGGFRFRRDIEADFLAWAKVPPERCHFFDAAAADLEAMCAAHEAAIQAAGGLDLIVMGLGENGHIASNEPGSALESRSRPVTLTRKTLAQFFPEAHPLPPKPWRAVTLGIATILEARSIVVLAAGAHKRRAVRALLEAPVSELFPCTALRAHRDVTVIVDAAAYPGD
ncbi:MAG TPA: 6-phosphogluconolactonase [Candidatus Sulfotelmatobacter sp.]|nr:6-phosphogluconolactonase [Candidatus Sulfotelmatobacter sp.]